VSKLAVGAAGALALIIVALLAGSGPAERLEQRSIDTRFQLRGDRPTDQIAVVAIDDATINRLADRWPLRRSFHADAIDRLRKAGARQIVYDVQFTEASDRPADDAKLFRAVRRARGIVLATAEADSKGNTDVLGGDDNLRRIGAEAGAAAIPAEAGGIARRYPDSVSRLDSLATVVARNLGKPVEEDDFRDGLALIDFAGPSGTIATYSFGDLVNGRVDEQVLRDRIVIVGVTTPTVQHRVPTSVGGESMSEPELQANAIRTALEGNQLRELPGWVEYLLLALSGGLVVLVIARSGPLRGAAFALAMLVLYALASQIAFTQDVVLPTGVPMVGIVVATIAAVLAAAGKEMAERRRFAGRNVELEDAVRARTAELELTHLEAVHRLARAAELRDGGTGEHLERMSRLCELVSLELGQSEASATLLRQAAVLHDVGKIGLPDRILNKPGKLSAEEIEVMRRHTTAGADLLDGSRSPVMALAEVVANTHHERWDGTGYPKGLSGDEIPLPGRIAAVCDVFDALITERPYKRAWSVAEARAEIEAQRGKHFDPAVADAALRVIGRQKEYAVSDNGAVPASSSSNSAGASADGAGAAADDAGAAADDDGRSRSFSTPQGT
jgi:CHASE2 domain-containing sensor protein